MAITSFDDYMSSRKQLLPFYKSASRTTSSNNWFSLLGLAGNPGTGTLAGSSTTAGVVPTSADAGFPVIGSVGSQRAYLTIATFSGTQPSRIQVFDLLWKGGAYNFNDNVTLSSQPSYASRLILDPDGQPGTSLYGNTQIWIEWVTGGSGFQSVAVTYTNQAGTTGRSTGTVSTVVGAVGRCYQLPLQAGDFGVQKIESVVGSVASAGTFNILVMRPLLLSRLALSNSVDTFGIDRTGMPLIFDTSALYPLMATDGSSTGGVDFMFEVASY